MISILTILSLTACTQPKADPAPAATPEPAVETEGAAAEVAEAADPGAIPEREDDASRASKNGHLVHTVAGVGIDIRFGRPKVQGRALWGELVPFDQVWRTGANEATTVAFDKDVTIEGEPLAAGVYALFTIPGESEWAVIFNKTPKQWGAYKRDAADDVLQVTVTPTEAEATEEMDFQGAEGGFVFRWGTLAVPVTVAPAG